MVDVELAKSVGDVERLLKQCVEVAQAENSAAGYFPLIYLWETRDLAAAADRGDFDSPEKLREMIVAFSNQYFSARGRFRAGQSTSRAWGLAFEAARSSSSLVIEHLLLAMNAHINLDLGVATAQVQMQSGDFQRVDGILAQGVHRIQAKLNRTSLLLRAADWLGGRFDELFVVYSLEAARRQAFSVAERLLRTPEPDRPSVISQVDDLATGFGRRLLQPPFRARVLLALARLTEPALSPREIVDLLARA
jgi:hypothetical protein